MRATSSRHTQLGEQHAFLAYVLGLPAWQPVENTDCANARPRVHGGSQQQLPMLGFSGGLDQEPLLAVVLAKLKSHNGGQAEVPYFCLPCNVHD